MIYDNYMQSHVYPPTKTNGSGRKFCTFPTFVASLSLMTGGTHVELLEEFTKEDRGNSDTETSRDREE